jgi:ureidoacrylate peracid hydrolase
MDGPTTTALQRLVRQGTTALVVIDFQNDYCHPRGSLGRAGWDLRYIDAAVDRTVQLIDESHAVGLPIIFVRTEHSSWTDTDMWRTRYKDFDVRTEPVCRLGSWGAEFYKVAPRADDGIVVKHRYDAFSFSDLELVLRSHGIRTLLFAGVATNVCIETTLREAFVRDYGVVLIEDSCATYAIEEHQSTIRNVTRYFGVVASGDDIASIIAGWSQREGVLLRDAASERAAAD